MLPACWTESDGFPMPQLNLSPREVEDCVPQLQSFPEVFHECFTRPEPRAHFFRYMVGQFRDLARQSIEPIALEGAGGNNRAMQRLLPDAVWDEEQRRWTYHHLVKDALGDPRGVVLCDEAGFPKQGQASGGVARQYCGSLGKVENGQVGGFAAYASPCGYALVDKRLCLPEAWFTDAYAVRRAQCPVPSALTLHTTPQ